MRHSFVTHVALHLAVLLLFAAGPLAGSGVDQTDRFLTEARAAYVQKDTDRLGRLVAQMKLTTYEAVNELLYTEDPADSELAEALALLYRDRFDDGAALERIRLFRRWNPAQHAIWREARNGKDQAKELLFEGRFQEARERYLDAAERVDSLGDLTLQAECLLGVGAVQANLGVATDALEWLGRARNLAERAGDRSLLAYIENNRAYALMDLGDLEGARTALSSALLISRESGERNVEASIELMLGSIALDLGELDEAEGRFETAGRIAEEIDNPEVKSVAWHNLALIHRKANRLDDAVAAYRRALQVAREMGSPKAVADTALSLFELERSRNRLTHARGWLDQARQAASQTDSNLLRASVELAEGALAAERGRHGRALEHLDVALSALNGLDAPQLLSLVRRNRGIAQFYLGNYDEAFAEAEKALSAATASRRPFQEAGARRMLAFLSTMVGDFEVGLSEIIRAIEIYEKLGDVTEQGSALNVLGFLRYRAGDYERARAAQLKALAVLDPAVAPTTYADVLLDLAHFELDRGAEQARTALESIRRAREISTRADDRFGLNYAGLLEAEFLLQAGKPAAARSALDRVRELGTEARTSFHEWRFHHIDGRIHAVEGNRKAARAAYRLSVDEVERLRSGAHATTWKATLLEDRIEPYRSLFRLHLDEGRIEEAYLVARMAKARTFVERLGIVGYEDLYAPPQELPAELFPAEVAPVAALQAALRPGEVLVDFFVEPTEVFAFVLRYSSFTMKRIDTGEAGLGGLVEAARYPGRPNDEDAAITRAFTRATDRLGRKLLDPIGRELDGAEHAIIVPNGELHAVPFAALTYGENRLIESVRVSVLPAAEVLLGSRRSSRTAGARILVLGDPEAGPGFERLPGAALEATEVARLFEHSAQLVLGDEARESVVRERAGSAELLHVAAHARLDSVFPANSFIALAPGDGEDGRWRASEIAAARIPASLVLLSGCGTAREAGLRSARSPGDEREGLVRAFLQAGASSIVANLWEMDDAVARVIIPGFYRRLKEIGPGEALAGLQRDLIRGNFQGPGERDLTHPFYWAGLVIYGAGLQSVETADNR